jgi:PII-like signaling protein
LLYLAITYSIEIVDEEAKIRPFISRVEELMDLSQKGGLYY